MPWKVTNPMVERAKFVFDAERSGFSIAELCRQYGISRKTGYRWISRYKTGGLAELSDRSHRTLGCPHQTAPEVVELLLVERLAHPFWGARKLLKRLRRRYPDLVWPADSTGNLILHRHGLTQMRRVRQRSGFTGGAPTLLSGVRSPNEVWTADYKGQFRLGDKRLCYPLTLMDTYSRFLLLCDAHAAVSGEEVWRGFQRAFREYGLPDRLRTDNGSPFASHGVCSLSRLSVRVLKLGIALERIEPGCPQQNGRHERMHRTLKREATRPPQANQMKQQEKFDRFRCDYNHERPHEALHDCTPSEIYRASWRALPSKSEAPGIEYPADFLRRQVRGDGQIKWRGKLVFISEALEREPVGIKQVSDGMWHVHFGTLLLGVLDPAGKFTRARPRERSLRVPG